MSFLSRLFGKKSQPKVVENKMASLESMSLEALVGVIQSGSDEQLHAAAIQKIDDQDALISLAGLSGATQTSASTQKTARQRIAQLIDSGSIDVDQFSKKIADKKTLLSVLALASNQILAENIVTNIHDENELAIIAIDGTTSKLRQRAAEAIVGKDILLQLLKDTKTKDKNVFKIVKDKCDLFKEEEKRKTDTLAAIEALVVSLEQQSNRPFDGQYSAKVGYLISQWQSKKADANDEHVARSEIAIAKCQQVIESISAEQAEAEARRKAEACVEKDRETLIVAQRQLLESLVIGAVADDQVQAQLAEASLVWSQLTLIKKPSQTEQKQFDYWQSAIATEIKLHASHGKLSDAKEKFEAAIEDASDELQSLYRHIKQRVNSLNSLLADNIPDVVLQAKSAVDSWEKTTAEKTAELQNLQRHIGGLIRKANDSIGAGVIGKAVGIRRAIDEKLQQLEQLPNHLANQLEQLDETLTKLQDWKNYAVLPKKQELIEKLESFKHSKEHPETLAVKIKRLQEEWKALSKGGRDQDESLWEKFHSLAQEVYQPCRDYFAEQAIIRQNNLNSCKQLVSQLQDYLANHDWAAANWKDVEKVIRVARAEWRNFTPTERAATQPVLADFEAALTAIQQKLNDEFNRNANLKKELIANAQQLVSLEDSRKATDEVKKLQAQWQTIGATTRKEEQHLWREFRDACDAVFAKRQQQSVEFKAELEANLTAANTLVNELNALSDLSGQALTDARKRVEEIRQAFGALGQFPKANVNDIKSAFTKAIDTFESKIQQESTALKQQIWVNLFNVNNVVRLYELSLIGGAPVDDADVQSSIAAISHWPAGGLKAIQQKLVHVSASADTKENLLALQELCIRAEILVGAETPAEYQAQRTAYQVNQLQQSFGRKAQDIVSEFEALIMEWIAVGAVETKEYDTLILRFNTCRAKAFN